MLILKKKGTYTETLRLMFDQIYGHHYLGKLMHKINHGADQKQFKLYIVLSCSTRSLIRLVFGHMDIASLAMKWDY